MPEPKITESMKQATQAFHLRIAAAFEKAGKTKDADAARKAAAILSNCDASVTRSSSKSLKQSPAKSGGK